MGKAYYREYRPLSLDAVVGQNHITDTLKNALKKGAISHAYLFTGPRGVGKTSIARILAHEINGLKYDEKETHIDIIEIDAASNRRIDEIRDLRDKVHIAPTSAKYKVYIIDEVHMLTREAFNALLKTLEEPPEHAVFILATTESHKVPETIISRTQRYSFKPLQNTSIVNHLRTIADKEELNIEDDALSLIAEHGRGSFRDSISMLDQIASFKKDKITASEVTQLLGIPDNDLLVEILQSLNSSDVAKLFELIQKLKEQGVNPAKTAQRLITTLRVSLEDNQAQLSLNRSVKLMKDLLPLTGSYGTFESLEIALLDNLEMQEIQPLAAPKPKTNNEPKAPKKAEPKPEPVPEPPTQEEQPPKSELAPEPIVPVDNNDDEWTKVLNALKSNHNSLYGLLRMAKVEINDKEITLNFGFGFHAKQAKNQKNEAILKNTIKEQLGEGYTVNVEFSKQNAKTKAQKPTKNEPDDNLKSVSNIFGGAELLES